MITLTQGKRQLRGVSDWTGPGVGHPDADPRRAGAAGPQAQEAHVEQGVEEPCG